MKRNLLQLLTVTLACVCLLPLSATAAGLEVLSPKDNVYVEHQYLNLALSVPDPEVTAVTAVVGKKTFRKQVADRNGKRVVCLGVTLENGYNTVRIEAANAGGRVLETVSLKIYRRSALSKQHQNPPAGIERYLFHQPEQEKRCASCHRMEPALADLNPARVEDSPCYTCHKGKTLARFTHKVTSSGGCLHCHTVKEGSPKYRTHKPDQIICFLCHSSRGNEWRSKRVHHGPTAVGNCSVCHDPHGSDWPDFVRMHPTDLCLNCHQDKKSGNHVIAGFFAKGHPVRGPKNPLKPGREFSCAGCHNPHAGATQSLLNGDRSNPEIYCQSCHKM